MRNEIKLALCAAQVLLLCIALPLGSGHGVESDNVERIAVERVPGATASCGRAVIDSDRDRDRDRARPARLERESADAAGQRRLAVAAYLMGTALSLVPRLIDVAR